MSGCNSRQPHQFPISRAPACAAESPKLSLPGAAPGRLANFHFWGRGRQVMHLPCKQADVGALPTDSTNFNSLRETRPMHRGKPHKLPQVGVTPTPATNFREVIRLPDCKSGVAKQIRKRRLERYQHFPPFRTRSSISRAPRCLREG